MAAAPSRGPQTEMLRRDLYLADRRATAALARAIAAQARRGDLIALSGDLGAGKTAFARDFIHARQASAGVAREEVPSPTFTLVQLYELPDAPVWHFDLYRLSGPDEVHELGLEEALGQGIALVEWPDRLGPLLPPERLEIMLLGGDVEEARRAQLAGYGGGGRRLAAAASG